MKIIFNILKKDFKRRIRSPWGIIILLAIPVIMTSMFGAVFGGGSSKNIKVNILVEDRDNGFLSRLMVKVFEVEDVKKFISAKKVKRGEGEELIVKKEASALLIIPQHFSENFINGEKNEFILVKNPSEQFLPQVVEDLSSVMVKLLSAISTVFGDELSGISKLIKDKSNIADKIIAEKIFSGSFDKIKRVAKFLSPPLLKLNNVYVGEKSGGNGNLNVYALLLPPISIMFLMFIIEIFMRDILKEKEDGTMKRILYSPVKPRIYVISKIVSGWSMGIVMFLILVIFGYFAFKIDWGNYLFLLIIVTVTSFSISAIFAFINSLLKDRKQAASVSAPIILILSALGGSMIPYSMLPPIIKKVSFLSINYWFMDGTNKILKSEFPLNDIAVIGVMGIVLFLLSYKMLIKRISE